MDWSTVISTIIGVIAGGLVTAFFSWQGSRELRREATELKQETDDLRRLNIMLMRLLDQAGVIPVKWDKQGNPLMTVTVESPPISTLFRKTKVKDEATSSEESSRG